MALTHVAIVTQMTTRGTRTRLNFESCFLRFALSTTKKRLKNFRASSLCISRKKTSRKFEKEFCLLGQLRLLCISFKSQDLTYTDTLFSENKINDSLLFVSVFGAWAKAKEKESEKPQPESFRGKEFRFFPSFEATIFRGDKRSSNNRNEFNKLISEFDCR